MMGTRNMERTEYKCGCKYNYLKCLLSMTDHLQGGTEAEWLTTVFNVINELL